MWAADTLDGKYDNRKTRIIAFSPVDIEILEPKNIQNADGASGRTFWLVYGIIYFTDYVYK